MLKVKKPFMATDENGDEVFVSKGDSISEVEDAGPLNPINSENEDLDWMTVSGWNVSFRLTPSHKLWTEIAIVDSVKLLKALEG